MIPFIAMLLSVSIIPDDWGFETSQSYVTSIFEDSDGTMWCSTSGGILHYDPNTGWDDPIVYPDIYTVSADSVFGYYRNR